MCQILTAIHVAQSIWLCRETKTKAVLFRAISPSAVQQHLVTQSVDPSHKHHKIYIKYIKYKDRYIIFTWQVQTKQLISVRANSMFGIWITKLVKFIQTQQIHICSTHTHTHTSHLYHCSSSSSSGRGSIHSNAGLASYWLTHTSYTHTPVITQTHPCTHTHFAVSNSLTDYPSCWAHGLCQCVCTLTASPLQCWDSWGSRGEQMRWEEPREEERAHTHTLFFKLTYCWVSLPPSCTNTHLTGTEGDDNYCSGRFRERGTRVSAPCVVWCCNLNDNFNYMTVLPSMQPKSHFSNVVAAEFAALARFKEQQSIRCGNDEEMRWSNKASQESLSQSFLGPLAFRCRYK